METTIGIQGSFCPACGSKLDAATSVDGDSKPKPGDFTVCLYCATVLRFDNELKVRRMTQAEISLIESDHDTWRTINRIIVAVKILHRTNPDKYKRPEADVK